MFESRELVKVGPKDQGKSFRIFRVADDADRSLMVGTQAAVENACIARFGRGEVRRASLGDYLPAPFTRAELRDIDRA